jgi:hypothetical protein
MRSIQKAVALALALTLAACGGEGEGKAEGPGVPVQGGEALQVEADPAATDTTPVGMPGATVQPDSQ